MSSILQKLYWKSPYLLKQWAASVNALRLERFRYGATFEKYCDEIDQRNNWSAEQFLAYQREQLRLLIQHATAKGAKRFAVEGSINAVVDGELVRDDLNVD